MRKNTINIIFDKFFDSYKEYLPNSNDSVDHKKVEFLNLKSNNLFYITALTKEQQCRMSSDDIERINYIIQQNLAISQSIRSDAPENLSIRVRMAENQRIINEIEDRAIFAEIDMNWFGILIRRIKIAFNKIKEIIFGSIIYMLFLTLYISVLIAFNIVNLMSEYNSTTPYYQLQHDGLYSTEVLCRIEKINNKSCFVIVKKK